MTNMTLRVLQDLAFNTKDQWDDELNEYIEQYGWTSDDFEEQIGDWDTVADMVVYEYLKDTDIKTESGAASFEEAREWLYDGRYSYAELMGLAFSELAKEDEELVRGYLKLALKEA